MLSAHLLNGIDVVHDHRVHQTASESVGVVAGLSQQNGIIAALWRTDYSVEAPPVNTCVDIVESKP